MACGARDPTERTRGNNQEHFGPFTASRGVMTTSSIYFQIVYACAFVSFYVHLFYSDKPPSSVRNVLGMVNVNTD